MFNNTFNTFTFKFKCKIAIKNEKPSYAMILRTASVNGPGHHTYFYVKVLSMCTWVCSLTWVPRMVLWTFRTVPKVWWRVGHGYERWTYSIPKPEVLAQSGQSY